MNRWSIIARLLLSAAVAPYPSAAKAHTFVVPYTLPVPFWLYLYACAATVAVTFAAVTYFASVPAPRSTQRTINLSVSGRLAAITTRWGLQLLRAGAVGCLALTVTAGLIGTASPLANINMTLFWILFLLGFTYLTALIGNLYEIVNPWNVMTAWAEVCGLDLSTARLTYPEWLGYYPAFLFYIALIWIELFLLPKPLTLSLVLIGYSLLTFSGAWLFGSTAWFGRAELFSVFFRLVSTLAPVKYAPAPDGRTWRVHLRWPFVGTLEEKPEHISLVLFVLFMLSSTTYDGLHDTVFWVGLFWKNLMALLHPLWGSDMAKAQTMLMTWYLVYQRAGLVLSPFLYFAVYMLVMAAAKVTTKTTILVRELALQFAFSVIPIALVYNVTHYYTLVLSQGRFLPYLAADPLGFGWNLLGIKPDLSEAPPLDMGVIWHTEVALILLGHMVSVCLAHAIALRVFPSRRQSVISQVPMLCLMMAYTMIGLWVLSLPLALH
jgi:hypothetical protein